MPGPDDEPSRSSVAAGRRAPERGFTAASVGPLQSGVDVGRRAVAAGLVPIHAGAVERQGSVVAIAGQSGAGKTTLTVAAVGAGWRFVADEVCAVDPETRRVDRSDRPARVRRGGAAALGVAFAPGEEAQAWTPTTDASSNGGTLAAIVLVLRNDGPPAIRPVTGAPALVQATRHLVVPDTELPPAFRGLELVVRATPVFTATFDAPDDGVRLLDRVVEP